MVSYPNFTIFWYQSCSHFPVSKPIFELVLQMEFGQVLSEKTLRDSSQAKWARGFWWRQRWRCCRSARRDPPCAPPRSRGPFNRRTGDHLCRRCEKLRGTSRCRSGLQMMPFRWNLIFLFATSCHWIWLRETIQDYLTHYLQFLTNGNPNSHARER